MEETKTAEALKREAELKELSARISLMESKIQKAAAESKIRYDDQMSDLRRKRDALQERINGLKNAGSGAWDDIKRGVEDAARDLRTALDAASKKFQ